MIKVIQFVSALNSGGAEALVKDYCLNIDKSQFEVKVVTMHPLVGSINEKLIKDAGIEIIPIFKTFPKNKLVKIFRKIFRKQIVYRKFKNIIKDEDVKVIHSHLHLLKYIKKVAKKYRDLKYFYTCHSIPSQMFYGKHSEDFNAAKYLYKNCNFKIIALHEKMKTEIDGMFKVKNTLVLNNCIDVSRFSEKLKSQEIIRECYNLPIDAFIVGHVGRFSKVKNHSFILSLFKECLNIDPKAHLLLVGDGAEKQCILDEIYKIGIYDCVTILSNRSDIPELMKSMDVLLFPSIYEGLPITVIEAQASGLKCVVSENITNKVFLTNNVIQLDLKEDINVWVNALLPSSKGNVVPTGSLDQFDTKNVIKQLEKLYL